jgi:F0F1-type ATP synthase alpha subunit
MDATININSSDFNEDLVKKIKALLNGKAAAITIKIKSDETGFVVNEDKEEYLTRISNSVRDIEEGRSVTFTMQELEAFLHK